MKPDDLKKTEFLKQYDEIPLPIAKPILYPVGKLVFDECKNGIIKATFTDGPLYGGKKHYYTHNLAEGPLTIGKLPGQIIQLPAHDVMSRQQAQVFMSGGVPTFKHLGMNDTLNPFFEPKAVDPAIASKQYLYAEDSIPILATTKTIPCGKGNIHIMGIKDNGVSLQLTVAYVQDGRVTGPVTEDLRAPDPTDATKTMALKVGRTPENQLQPKSDVVSKLQGLFTQENGVIMYTHKGRNKILNPHYDRRVMPPAPEFKDVGAIESEGGSMGGGYTNGGGKRADNWDRAIAHQYLPLEDAGKIIDTFSDLVTTNIGPALKAGPGGTTLSLGMRAQDGKFAGITVGDSPVYFVMKHKLTGQVRLGQVNIPDTLYGNALKGKRAEMARPSPIWDEHPELRAIDPNKFEPGLINYIGDMGAPKTKHVPYNQPAAFSFHPINDCPQGYESLGLLICSDGVEKAVRAGVVQQALTAKFSDRNANPTAQDVSKVVVDAAVAFPDTTDNVTATYMSMLAPPGTLIALADGNSGSHLTAEGTISRIRQKCLDRPKPTPRVDIPLG